MPEDVTEAEAPDTSNEIDLNEVLANAEADPEPDEALETEEAPPAVADKGKKPVAPPTKPAAAAAAPDDLSDLLTEGVKFTPETLKTAAQRVQAQAAKAQELTDKGHKVWGTAEKRAKKLERQETEFRQVRGQFAAQVQQFNAAWSGIKTGDAKTALEGLRALTGRDPVEVLDELNVHIATNGKKKKPAPEVEELRNELESIKRSQQQRDAAEEDQRAQQFVRRRQVQLLETAGGAADDYPIVAELATENPRGVAIALTRIIVEGAQSGRKVADRDAIRMLEEELQAQSELSERARSKRRTAGLVPGHGTGNPGHRANPGPPLVAPPKGKSLSVSAATAASVKRELTEEELSEDAANFLPPALLAWSRNEA